MDVEFVRTFICLELPANIQEIIEKNAIALLRETGASCSWVKPGNIHLTLKFLGDVPVKMIPKISERVEDVISGYSAMRFSPGKVGTFGGRIPRIVWVGLDGDAEMLVSLAGDVDRALSQIGFEKEKKLLSPHLTIGRVRNPGGSDKLVFKSKEIILPKEDFIFDKVTVMQSVLSPGGSIYTPLKEFELKK
jgi:2'-5' RNA ligase